jgi:hypothetical protein
VALVKHSTANVISTIVIDVRAVRNLRRRMFAMPSNTALISTLARAKLAVCGVPRPLRRRFSSVSNFPYTTPITTIDMKMIANERMMISGEELILNAG